MKTTVWWWSTNQGWLMARISRTEKAANAFAAKLRARGRLVAITAGEWPVRT